MFFKDNSLRLEIEPEERDDADWEVGRHGLKQSSVKASYFVDFSKFDVDNAQAEFEDGVLVVTIPPNENYPPKKVSIK